VADIDRLIGYINEKIGEVAKLSWPEEYYYPHLIMCVLDAIFSINALYDPTVKNVVSRYCSYYKISRPKINKGEFLPPGDQERISDFVARVKEIGWERMAVTVFQNQQRTSTTNGILKAEAAYRVAVILKKYGVEYFQDVPTIWDNKDFESEFLSIKGQKEGISLSYFWMLSGDENSVKPDRRLVEFLSDALGRKVSSADTTNLVVQAANNLTLPPALLDYGIWDFQRKQGKRNSKLARKGCCPTGTN
jgi:hypothetical protein